jgi:hypothetical protein
MISNTGYIYTSTDGITWTNRTSGLEGNAQAGGIPAYVNDRWVIPGTNNGTIGDLGVTYSTDGVTWSYLNLSAVLTGQIIQVFYGAGTWAAISNNTTTTNGIAYSTTSFTSGWGATTKPATNVLNHVNIVNFKGTNYWLFGASSGVIFWGTAITTLTSTTVGSTDHNYVGSFKGSIILAGNTAALTTAVGSVRIMSETSGTTDLSAGWGNIQLGDGYLIPTTYQIGINYGVLMMFPVGTVTVSGNTGAYPGSSIAGNMAGGYRMLTSLNGYTWTIRTVPWAIANIRGAAITQANGIMCYATSNQWYMTTAYNSANIFINSTNLTTLN